MIRSYNYPLTTPGLLVGVVAGVCTALFADLPLGGLAVFVLSVTVGLTWRRGEVPIFPFILAVQWVSVTIALFHERWLGPLSHSYEPGDLDRTVLLSLSGLAVLALGMRCGAGSGGRDPERDWRPSPRAIAMLFWLVIAAYAADYAYALNPKRFFGADVIIEKLLSFRSVLLVTLWAAVLATRGNRRYLVVSFVWALVPTFGSYFSTFRIPVFLLVLIVAARWEPWDAGWWRQHGARALGVVPLLGAAVFLAVLWQGAVKYEVRAARDREQVASSPLQRVDFFLESASANLPLLMQDSQAAVGELTARLSYLTFFSRVLEYTPAVERHAGGELLRMALVNGFVPRLLFRDKPVLPSDSEYTERFTGIRVASTDQTGTSISIGYMAEFYADWGLIGMFLSVLAYGVWIGLLHRGVRLLVSTPALVDGTLVMVLLPCMLFEHQFIKGFGSLNMGFAVSVGLAMLVGPSLMRLLESGAPVSQRLTREQPAAIGPVE